jgi:hypothetical protein
VLRRDKHAPPLPNPFAPPESARGLAHSKTLRAIRASPANALRFGLRQPSAAFSEAFEFVVERKPFSDNKYSAI